MRDSKAMTWAGEKTEAGGVSALVCFPFPFLDGAVDGKEERGIGMFKSKNITSISDCTVNIIASEQR